MPEQNAEHDSPPGIESGQKPTQADRLVALAFEKYDFGMSETGEPFVVAREGLRVARLVSGNASSLKAEMSRSYFMRHGKTASASALSDAVTTLHGFAMTQEPTCLQLRQAAVEDELWLDLGDQQGSVIHVTKTGWSVEPQAPVMFRRSELTGVMPVPVPGETGELRRFLNVSDEGWALIIGWMVSAYFPGIQHPILALTGEQGTAKTSTARMIGAIIDPSPAPLTAGPRDIGEWIVVANGACLVGLDNLSQLQPWFSDALCRAITGEGLVRRRLYSDADLIVTSFRKLILMTGIDLGALSADLVDRTVFVELQRIPSDQRRRDSELWARFNEAQPRILGGLLDLVAATMRALPDVDSDGTMRMGDHVRVLAALDVVIDAGCVDAYRRSAGRAMADAAECNPLADALIEFMSNRKEWTGTASELLRAITPDLPPRGWPSVPNRLSGLLKRLAPVLRECGVEVESSRGTGRARTRLLKLTAVRATDDADDGSQFLFKQ